jgi:amino acid transporter
MHVSSTEATPAAHSSAERGLFARRATGLVRGISPRSSLIMNLMPGHPAQGLAAGFFFVFVLFPGGNYLLGLLLTIPLGIAVAYAFGLLTQMIPRSGGDYMLVSRVLHPAVGLISSFCMTLAGLFSNAFFGIAFTTIGLGPGLIGIGLVGGSDTLVDWGTTIQSTNGWKYGMGVAMMALSALILAGGWRWTIRIQNVLFWMVTSSVGISVLIALFTSKGHFISNFNDFAQPITGKADTYHNVINAANKAGVDTNPAFSMKNTIAIMGFFASFSIFSYWSAFVGGEVRQASTMKMANNMALASVGGTLVVAICAVIFFKTFGTDFMIAANGGGFPSQIATSPTYFFLTGASTGSGLVTFVLTLCYVVFWPLICYISMIQPTRMIFAYSFDGILPKGVTKVSRNGSPYVAVVIVFIASAIVLLWAINAASFFQVLVYATLIQLISTALIGISAILVPYRKPDLYQASSSQRSILGVPATVFAGIGAVCATVLIWVLYFSYKKQFGLTNLGQFFGIFGGTVGLAVLYYLVVRTIKRSRGMDLDMAYAEIPPE